MKLWHHAVLLLCAGTAAAQPPQGDPRHLEFARKLETTLSAGDATFLDRVLDFDAMLDKAMQGLDAPAAQREGFRTGVKAQGRLGPPLVTQLKKENSSYRLLRLRKSGERPTALFRLIADGGLNYHEMALRTSPAGAVQAEDIYLFLNGEWLSESFRRGWLIVASEVNKTLLSRLLRGENEYMTNLAAIRTFQGLVKEGKAEAALKAYRLLPPSVQASKTILLQRIYAALALGGQPYDEAVSAFRAAFPGDAALDILSIDFYMTRKEYDNALGTLERVDKSVGGDPYVHFLKGNVLTTKGDLPAAKSELRRAITDEPTLAGPYWSLVEVHLQEKDFPATARLLNEIESQLPLKIGDLTKIPVYAEFIRSDAYKRWRQERARR